MDTANLVVNIFIALGTIGAASVALWLGIQAQRTSASQAREARLKLTREVFCIYNPAQPSVASSSVELVNASTEVITRVIVHVSARVDPGIDPATRAVWQWEDPEPTDDFSTVRYLLPGTNTILHGQFGPPTPIPNVADENEFAGTDDLDVGAQVIPQVEALGAHVIPQGALT